MKLTITNLKKLKYLIGECCYDQAVELATRLGLPAYHGGFEGTYNNVEYWEINYPNPDGSYCYLLDAAYTTGAAGWYRLDGRWL